MTIPEIAKLLEDEKFDEVEVALYELEKADHGNTSAAFLFGKFYEHYSNPARSVKKARRYFSKAAKGNPPVDGAFSALARLEGNSSHAIRILEKGLSLFPEDENLFLQLFRRSPLDAREMVYTRADKQGLASDDMRPEMVSAFVALCQYEKALRIGEGITKKSLLEIRDLMAAICLLKLKQIEKAAELFRHLVNDDIDHKFAYVPQFGLILSSIERKPQDAIDLLSEIPNEVAWDSCAYAYYPFYFSYAEFVFDVIKSLEKLPIFRDFLPKLRALRGLLINANPEQFALPCHRTRMLKDFEYARRHMPQNALICKALHDERVQKGDYLEAYTFAVAYFACAVDDNDLDLGYFNTLVLQEFEKIAEDFKKRLSSQPYGLCRAGGVFDQIAWRLYREKKYSAIVELAEIAGDYCLEKTRARFEIAYSFAEVEKRGQARKHYTSYIQKNSESGAALNNLAILEEFDGQLDKAEALLRRCVELNAEHELAKNNLKRVLKLKGVLENFQRDDLDTRRFMIELWRKKWPGHEFECTAADLQSLLPSASPEQAKTWLRQLTEKGYLEPKADRGKFQISAGLRGQMTDLERAIEKEGEIAKLAGEISKENLEKMGFDDNLLGSLAKIGNAQLQSLLKRDLKEAALARLTNCHKTALVMCGSIIEAVLTDKIMSNSIRSYKLENGKKTSVSRMDLGDLLYVATEEKLIDDQLNHLAHALRGFRNLIHPGVEQRKTAMAPSESNARIAWDITRKLLLEI